MPLTFPVRLLVALPIALACLSCLTARATAASFDCAKAKTATEKLLCSDDELGRLDEELAKAYGAAAKRLGDGGGLRKAQATWRQRQRDACKDAPCLRARMQERIDELWATAKPRARTGTYSTEDGQLEVLELPQNVLRFALEITVITRSGEPHLGQLCGQVTLARGRGIYRDPQSTDDEPDCVLELVAGKDALEVLERAHCSSFSDQVSARGRYRRSSKAPPLLELCQEVGR